MVFREGNFRRKLKITSRPGLTLCPSDSTPKLKANMIKQKVIRTQTEQFLELFSRNLNDLCPKDVKISLYITVLIVRGCFDRTHGLNKLFFHLVRALCFSTIMISYLVLFSCMLLIRNNMIFLVQFGINKHSLSEWPIHFYALTNIGSRIPWKESKCPDSFSDETKSTFESSECPTYL